MYLALRIGTVHISLSAYSESIGIARYCESATKKAKPFGTLCSKVFLHTVLVPLNAAQTLATQTLRRRSTISTLCVPARPLKQVEGARHSCPTRHPTGLIVTEDPSIHALTHVLQHVTRLHDVCFPYLEVSSKRPRLPIPGKLRMLGAQWRG